MLEWSDALLIGNERIDFEHHTFFGLVADFQKARINQADKKTLTGLLEEIALYAKFHFRSEENVMEQMRYPDLENHRKDHYHLIEVLSNKMLGLEMDLYSAKEIEDFLVEWFVGHTSRVDKKIAQYQQSLETRPDQPE